MTQARNASTGNNEDISGITKGSAYLREIWPNQFLCINTECSAQLILCSIRITNSMPPHFRTLVTTNHISNCSAANDSIGKTFNPANINSRRNGVSAFNKILRNETQDTDERVAIYNHGTKKVITFEGRRNNRSISKARVKVGPILYDESLVLLANITYKIQCSDIRNAIINMDQHGYKWINLENTGIKIPANSILQNEKEVFEYEIILLPQWIKTPAHNPERKYTSSFSWILKKNGELKETYLNRCVTSY